MPLSAKSWSAPCIGHIFVRNFGLNAEHIFNRYFRINGGHILFVRAEVVPLRGGGARRSCYHLSYIQISVTKDFRTLPFFFQNSTLVSSSNYHKHFFLKDVDTSSNSLLGF